MAQPNDDAKFNDAMDWYNETMYWLEEDIEGEFADALSEFWT
jgi:hypothetical protein